MKDLAQSNFNDFGELATKKFTEGTTSFIIKMVLCFDAFCYYFLL
jgi:hypothetical protein